MRIFIISSRRHFTLCIAALGCITYVKTPILAILHYRLLKPSLHLLYYESVSQSVCALLWQHEVLDLALAILGTIFVDGAKINRILRRLKYGSPKRPDVYDGDGEDVQATPVPLARRESFC